MGVEICIVPWGSSFCGTPGIPGQSQGQNPKKIHEHVQKYVDLTGDIMEWVTPPPPSLVTVASPPPPVAVTATAYWTAYSKTTTRSYKIAPPKKFLDPPKIAKFALNMKPSPQEVRESKYEKLPSRRMSPFARFR